MRTMQQKRKFDNVKEETNRMNVDILGIPEVTWIGAGSFKSDGYTTIYSGKQNHERRVEILFNQKSSSSFMGLLTSVR